MLVLKVTVQIVLRWEKLCGKVINILPVADGPLNDLCLKNQSNFDQMDKLTTSLTEAKNKGIAAVFKNNFKSKTFTQVHERAFYKPLGHNQFFQHQKHYISAKRATTSYCHCYLHLQITFRFYVNTY